MENKAFKQELLEKLKSAKTPEELQQVAQAARQQSASLQRADGLSDDELSNVTGGASEAFTVPGVSGLVHSTEMDMRACGFFAPRRDCPDYGDSVFCIDCQYFGWSGWITYCRNGNVPESVRERW